MHIIINGENKELPETLSVDELIRQLELPQMRVAIEINREVVRRADWMLTLLRDGDRVEIVHFVGGGSIPENLLGRPSVGAPFRATWGAHGGTV